MSSPSKCPREGCTNTAPKGRKFCSPACFQEDRRARQRIPKTPNTCPFCKEEFAPFHQGDITCDKAECKSSKKQADTRKASGISPEPVLQRMQHPTGYEPGYELNGDTGTVTSEPTATPPDRITSYDWLLERWHLDPLEFEVIEPVNIRTWLGAIGNQETREFYYYKSDIRRRTSTRAPANLEQLRSLIKATKPRRWKQGDLSDRTAILTMADLQLGKADGDGTDGTIARFFSMLETTAATCDRLASRGVEELVIPWLGDLVENVDGHYAMQGFTTDRNLNEQVETAALLYLALNKTLAPMFPRVLNVVVPGNHGEVRKDGKAHTDFGDNHDVTAPYLGHQAITDTLPHVRFLRPSKPDLTATVEIRGRIHGFMHGHQGKVSGPTAHARIIEWHRRQAAGQRAMGDAEFVWSAHYHHASIAAPNASRVYIQSPALDGGSPWYAETKGDESEPGTFMGLLNGKRGMAGFDWFTVIEGSPRPMRFADRIAT